MKIKKCLKRLLSLFFALGMVFSSVLTPSYAEDSTLQIDVSGSGTVYVTRDGNTSEITESVTLNGDAGEEVTISAKAADGNYITAFATYTDADSQGLSFGDKT